MIDSIILTDERWGSSSVCRRGCCWTPFGHSPVADHWLHCRCHDASVMRALQAYIEHYLASQAALLKTGVAA